MGTRSALASAVRWLIRTSNNTERDLKATSPDELALLSLAEHYGFKLKWRNKTEICISVERDGETDDLICSLHNLQGTMELKQMDVVIL